MSRPQRGGLLNTQAQVAAALFTVSAGLYFGASLPGIDMGGAGAIACVAVGAAFNRNSAKFGDFTQEAPTRLLAHIRAARPSATEEWAGR